MGGIPNNPFFNSRLSTCCSDLIIRTQLFSPIQSVLKKVSVGDEFVVKLLGKNGPCVASFGNDTVGSIITKDLLLLIDCINKGQDFIAIVRTIRGGSCAITIKAVTSV